ncbi:MAG: sel1 repeat family protein [Candidatus Latescibacteria bacterium]|jgi:uncharacterized protein|nr:sel1 repeat family protein [Candidatus Latescibacterota bacterium]
MPSRKKWKYIGVGIVGGALGSAGLLVATIFIIALWPSSPSTSGVVLSDIGCPTGMLENMATGKCVMSDETEATVSTALRKLSRVGSSNHLPNVQQIKSMAKKAASDETLTFKLYRIAAFLGDGESQYEVGGMLSKGRGAREANMEALRWLHEAAHNDHLEAQVRLAHMLSSGTFVKKDKRLASDWLHRAEANRKLPKSKEVGI